MSGTPTWTWLLPAVFAAPWIAAALWVVRRTSPTGEVPPSFAQRFLR